MANVPLSTQLVKADFITRLRYYNFCTLFNSQFHSHTSSMALSADILLQSTVCLSQQRKAIEDEKQRAIMEERERTEKALLEITGGFENWFTTLIGY